ncbi:hypothetical protein ACFQ9X_53585 [Catenulispora yoronensis]
MTTLNGFAYAELSFGADGSTTDPAQSTSAPALALGADVTDLLVLAHGWNNDPPAARNLYDGLTAAMARCGGAPAGLAVLGVLWPAKQYDAAPAVAANIAADPSGQAAEALCRGCGRRSGLTWSRRPRRRPGPIPGISRRCSSGWTRGRCWSGSGRSRTGFRVF